MRTENSQNMKKEAICAIVSGYYGTAGLQSCIENLAPVVNEILIIDAENVSPAELATGQVQDYSRKSLNDVVVMINARDENEKPDWLFLHYANETAEKGPAALLKELHKKNTDFSAIQFPVATAGAAGKIEFCQLEIRLVRTGIEATVGPRNQLSIEGKIATRSNPVFRDSLPYARAPFSKVHLRIRDEAVRYWERCPDDLRAVFSFFQFLHWSGDNDEIANNCQSTLKNFGEQIRQNSEYWGLFAICAAACFRNKELDAFEQTVMQARETLPEKHLDLLYLKCLDAKLNNDHVAIIEAAEKFLHRSRAVKKSPLSLAKNSVYALGFEKQVNLWKLASQTALERWQPAISGLRQLTKVPDFLPDDALEILEEMQFIASDKLSNIMPILWKSFASPQFIIDSLKIFPFDILNTKTRNVIVKDLLPQYRKVNDFAAGELFMLLGYFQDALDVFLQLVYDSAYAEKAMFNAAQMYLELGYFEDATKILASLLHQFPANRDARLLFEGLNPDVGEVRPADENMDDEIEQTLLEAVEAINHYVEKQKFDPVFSLVQQVHDVLAPYSEIKVEIFSDFAPALTRIESLAISHCYLQLADEIQKLKSTLKSADAESKINPD